MSLKKTIKLMLSLTCAWHRDLSETGHEAFLFLYSSGA